MGKNQSASGLTNIVQYDNNGNISFVSGSTTLMQISSSGAITTTGVISGSNALSSSYALNSGLLNGTGSVGFATTGSLLTVSSSQQQISASQQQISSSLLALTASYNALSSSYTALSASYNTASSSFSTRITSDSSSLSSRTTQIENVYATTGSNTFTGTQNFSNTCTPNSFTAGASIYTAGGLRVTQDAYFSSSVYIKGNVTVFGTQSVSYISSSQLDIGTNIITVNTSTPSVRYGGLSVFDSGSTGLTGSIFWDSELNRWIYVNASGSGGGATYGGGMFISGPRNSVGLGCEQGTTACMLLAGQGGDHLTSSMIYHSSTATCVPNTLIGSTICTTMANASCIGIGTAIPTYDLTLSKSVAAGNVVLNIENTSTTGAARLWLGNNASSTGARIQYFGATHAARPNLFSIGTDAANDMMFETSGTERARITSTGIACFACQVCVPNIISTGASGGRYATFSAPSNGGYITFDAGGTAFGDLGSYCAQYGTGDATTLLLGSRTGYALALGTNSTERLRITSTGVVGIGTNAPVTDDGNLVVAGCVGTGQGAANTVAQINIWETTSANKAGLWFGSMTNATTGVIGSRTATGNIAFQTYCGGWAERMRIAYNGSVGIGTTITTGKVNIQQTINDSGLYFFNCASGTRFMFNHYCGSGINSLIIQEFDASNTFCRNIMAFASGGNVGIATASPSTLLQVSPGASYANNPTIQIIQSYADGYDAILSLTNCHTGGRNWSIRSTNNSQGNFGGCKLVFQDTTAGTHTSVMTLVAGGNVGIGTATPSEKLTVYGAVIRLEGAADVCAFAIANNNSSGFRIYDYNAGVDRLRITTTGNVGIGTGDTGGTICRRFEVYCATSGQTSNAIMRLTSGTNGAYGGETNFEFAFRDFGNSANYSVPAKIRAEYYEATGTDVSGKLEFYTKAAGGNDSCLPVLRMTISCGGNIGAPNGTNIYNASDSRLKRNVSTITCGINKVMSLNPVKFNWIEGFEASEQDKDMLGFVAQEVQSIIPEAVENFGLSDIYTSQGLIENPLRVNEKFIIPVLVKAIQEQQCKIALLESCLGIA